MKKSLFKLFAIIFFFIFIFSAVLPLFGKNYIPTHDGEYHIIRIVEFSKMISQGNLFPRWAPDLNSGYGIPIFEFHYPLPNYVGSLVRTVTHDAVYAFQISAALGYIVAVACIFAWLYVLFGFWPSIMGAIAGAYVPYWFVDLYVRGSVGEVWATAFLFMTLYFIEKKQNFFIAISYGLLIVSHNILAMVYSPFIFLYILFRYPVGWKGLIGGIGMSAFFWLPALLESKYVVGLNTVNFREHFVQLYEFLVPSWGSEFSGLASGGNKMSFQIGLVPIISIIGGLFVLKKEKDIATKQLYKLIIGVLFIALLAMLSVSRIIWEVITPLQYIQYPWRLLAFAIPATAFSSALWIRNIKHSWIGIILVILAVIFAYSYTRPVLYQPRNEAYYLARSNFTDGTSSMGNSFSTIWTGWKETKAKNIFTLSGGVVSQEIRNTYLVKEYQVQMNQDGEGVFSVLYFPGWIVKVDSHETPITHSEDGIIHITIPKGNHSVKLMYTDTPIRKIGNIISLFSLAIIIGWGILGGKKESRY